MNNIGKRFAVLPLKQKDIRMWNVDTSAQKCYWPEAHRSVEPSIQHSVCRDNHFHPAAALLRFNSASLSSTSSQEGKRSPGKMESFKEQGGSSYEWDSKQLQGTFN